MNNFIFSLGIAMPIFLVMCVGYLLRKREMINESFVKMANDVIFKVALPIMFIADMMEKNFNQYFDIKFILFCLIGTLATAILSWLLGAVLLKRKEQLGAFIQGAFRGNFVYVGLSLMINMTGSMGLKSPLIIAFVTPLYNILAVIILTFTNKEKLVDFNLKRMLKDTLFNICKNPLIISIFIGILLSELGLKLPLILSRTAGYFSNIVTPLALLSIGATFNFQGSKANILPTVHASLLKLVIFPLIFVLLAIWMGFSNQDVLLIYVLFGTPTAATTYIMTASMGGDAELSSNLIMVTTLLSVVSMTIFVYAFKSLGMI